MAVTNRRHTRIAGIRPPNGNGTDAHGTDDKETVSGEATIALPVVLQIIASIVAPTTLLTALLFYFGRMHAQGLTRYLRVQFTVFDFTTQDYLVRSADGLFIPLVMAAVIGVFAIWWHRLVFRRLPAPVRSKVVVGLAPLAGVAGLLLVGFALVSAFGGVAFDRFPEAGGLSLSVGVLLLAYAVQLVRMLWPEKTASTSREAKVVSGAVVAEWGAIFALFSVGLFWAVNSYAIGVGTSRGQQIERELATTADAVVYSQKSLDLQVRGVREVVCSAPATTPDAAYRYRYEGLKLILQSGGQYLFLPATWNPRDGVALVIPRSDTLRLEFSPPGRGVRPSC